MGTLKAKYVAVDGGLSKIDIEEMKLWELMVQQCAALAAAGRVYTVEET
ncbi:MAG: hypothetical protein JZD41_08990 [Thermoproteus sp.]|nr:hypothetical protein [Thermoproteus sp.]